MSHIHYIVASLSLLISGIYCTGIVFNSSPAYASQQEFLPNVQYTLEGATSKLYLQKLVEISAYEKYGQPVTVVID